MTTISLFFLNMLGQGPRNTSLIFFLIIVLHLGESYICIFRYKVISVGTDSYKEETHNHKLVLSQERLCRC